MIEIDLRLAQGGFILQAAATIPHSGITALFGPSGCGKTTLLRCIAGLARAHGTLRVGDDVWQAEKVFLPVHRRPLGYVFQEASLFPHLSVRANLEYGYRRIPPAARKLHPEQVAEWLGLGRQIDRSDVAQLSGGERQRVAIGRALLSSPRLMLMDEPLAALDARSKQEILPYLERLHRELAIPVLYVSHSMDEVARLADHLVLLEQGRVVASGALHETLARLDLAIAHYDDAGAIIEAQVAEQDAHYGMTRLLCDGGSLWVGQVAAPPGTPLRVRVLARDVSIALTVAHDTSINNILPAQIAEISDEGADKLNVRLALGASTLLLARITRRSCERLGLVPGMQVFAQIKSVALM